MGNSDPFELVNWDEIDEAGGPVVEGDYTLKARKAEVVPTKDGKGINVRIMWTHEAPEFRGNMPVSDYFTFRPLKGLSGEELAKNKKTIGFTKRKIRTVFGEVPDGFGPNDIKEAIVGRVVTAVLKQESYTTKEGKSGVSNKIEKYVA